MQDYWHALAMLRLDRPLGLTELESCFAGGKAAEDSRFCSVRMHDRGPFLAE